MKRTAGFCVAAAMACAVSLGAQTSTTTAQRSATTDKTHDVTVTGCLARDTSGSGFMLNNAREDNGASSTTTTGTSTTTGAAGTTTTGGATTTTTPRAGSNMSNMAMSWTLSGGNDLDKHVGHKIQVTGKTSYDSTMSHTSTASAAGAGTTGSLEGQRRDRDNNRSMQPRIEVQSFKMISASCS